MPAWMTSELRELVCTPIALSASTTSTSRPARASARATASPTTPAPTTTQSTRSMSASRPGEQQALEHERREPGTGDGDDHRPRAALEQRTEQRAERGAAGELDRPHERRSGSGALREG